MTKNTIARPGARLHHFTHNPKIAQVVAVERDGGRPSYQLSDTYRAADTLVAMARTCPSYCPWYGHGCYAEHGFTAFTMEDLNAEAAELTSTDVIMNEVELLKACFEGGAIPDDGGGRPLPFRLHVAGDVGCAEDVGVLGFGVEDILRRGAGPVWSPTHRWREIAASAWPQDPRFNVQASVETPADLEVAWDMGYRSALLVVPSFPSGTKRFAVGDAGFNAVPCVEQTHDTPCTVCRLCLVPGRLPDRMVVALGPHGPGRAQVRAQLLRKLPDGRPLVP